MREFDCDYCEKEFDKEKRKLQHELKDHEDEMSSHDTDEKKSELNKLDQKKQTSKHNRKKKLQFAGIGVLLLGLVAGGGFYAVQNLGVNLNGVQETNESIGVGTPVHWHADYTLTVCCDNQRLKGGPVEAHTHGQPQLHLEGVRDNKEEATLDWIIDSLGGELENNSVMGQSTCKGEPAELTVQANGESLENPLSYIPRDGDRIEISLES